MFSETLAFLHALYPPMQGGLLTLTAIYPNRQRFTPSHHIRLGDELALTDTLTRLLAANRAGWGAYLSVATRKADLGRWRRGGRTDLNTLSALFVDIDRRPESAQAQLRVAESPPSCLVHSGSGLHAYWFLQQPTNNFDLADYVLRRLAMLYNGDTTNVTGALRLPGSINTKPGRSGASCQVIELHPDRRYRLEDFPAVIPPSDSRRQLKTVLDFNTVQPIPSHIPCPLNPNLIRAIVDRLLNDCEGYVKANGYIAALCPCGHHCDCPGQHFNFDASRAFGTCFGRHGRLLLKDLCIALHVDPTDYGGLRKPSPCN